MSTGRATPLLQRAKRAATFVALVWGVAGSFVMFEVLALSGVDRLLPYGSAVGTLALPRVVQDSPVCRVAGESGGTTRVASADARVGAWNLGVQTGVHSRASLFLTGGEPGDEQTRQWRLGIRQMVDATDAEVERLAKALGVPRPVAFTPKDVVMANTEFVSFVE